jgi:hypothetical protein
MNMNMNYEYNNSDNLRLWANARETHIAVANAIFAIADSSRTAESIWENPTSAEWDHVVMAVEQYLANDLVKTSPDGRYEWGLEAIELCVARPLDEDTKKRINEAFARVGWPHE